ncbi:MAG: hypothetical protein AB1898_16450 [Acidobacteriota bacterium]
MGARFLDRIKGWLDKSVGEPPQIEFERVQYPMPESQEYDLYHLDPLSKRRVTICNLFANHRKSIPEIVSILETSPKLVIDTLLENKLVKDRRRSPRPRTPAPEELKGLRL